MGIRNSAAAGQKQRPTQPLSNEGPLASHPRAPSPHPRLLLRGPCLRPTGADAQAAGWGGRGAPLSACLPDHLAYGGMARRQPWETGGEACNRCPPHAFCYDRLGDLPSFWGKPQPGPPAQFPFRLPPLRACPVAASRRAKQLQRDFLSWPEMGINALGICTAGPGCAEGLGVWLAPLEPYAHFADGEDRGPEGATAPRLDVPNKSRNRGIHPSPETEC